jgi:hypothetical protein
MPLPATDLSKTSGIDRDEDSPYHRWIDFVKIFTCEFSYSSEQVLYLGI